MSSKNENISFEAMIQADRNRRKNEDLAASIFGRSSSHNGQKNKKDNRSPSLASRMGVQKRHSSSTATSTQKSFNPPSRPSSTTPSTNRSNNQRANRLANELSSPDPATINLSSKRKPNPFNNGAGLSIKGTAGPFVVEARNFATGTTAADIEASFQNEFFDDNRQNCLQQCRVIDKNPVTVEMVFSEKSVAEQIIRKFDGMRADGKTLGFRLVRSGPGSVEGERKGRKQEDTAATVEVVGGDRDGDMDMDDAQEAELQAQSAYDHEREAADRDRRDRDRNRDRDGYVSGSASRNDDRDRTRDDRKPGQGVEELRRDDRDRERERDRDREGRDRERERERDYERRDSYHDRERPRQNYGGGMNNGGMQQQPQQGYGSYGGGYRGRGGYGYAPRGYGGPRGGYRGGFNR